MRRFLIGLPVVIVACGQGAAQPSLDGGAGTGGPSAPLACGLSRMSICARADAVAARVVLPAHAGDFAVDLDGDGKPDNRLASLLSGLASAGFTPQDEEDAAVRMGTAIVALNEDSVDATFMSDPGSAVGRVLRANPQPTPDYSGVGAFTLTRGDGAVAAFQGAIAAGVFSAAPAPSVTVPETITFPIAPFLMADVPLYAVTLTITNTRGAPNSAQLNGAWKASDVQSHLLPALAADLTARIAATPASPSSAQIEQLFDVGDGAGGSCANPDGSAGAPMDGVISACEVGGNALIAALFAPDVQLFDAAGHYRPTSGGIAKDALSVGVQLTLVPAQLQ